MLRVTRTVAMDSLGTFKLWLIGTKRCYHHGPSLVFKYYQGHEKNDQEKVATDVSHAAKTKMYTPQASKENVQASKASQGKHADSQGRHAGGSAGAQTSKQA